MGNCDLFVFVFQLVFFSTGTGKFRQTFGRSVPIICRLKENELVQAEDGKYCSLAITTDVFFNIRNIGKPSCMYLM